MSAKKRKSVFGQIRHGFKYRVANGSGVKKEFTAWAKVRPARKVVTLILTEDHVKQSIRMKGRGSTVHCSMAICTYAHAHSFPHPVEGHVDWQYSRAFVVTKLNRMGLPCECVAYEHDSDIARNQDLPGGQQELLKEIQDGGPLTVQLRPYRKRSEEGRSGKGRKATGKRAFQRKGAGLRYDVAAMGAIPPAL